MSKISFPKQRTGIWNDHDNVSGLVLASASDKGNCLEHVNI